jgi:hypothetical protein
MKLKLKKHIFFKEFFVVLCKILLKKNMRKELVFFLQNYCFFIEIIKYFVIKLKQIVMKEIQLNIFKFINKDVFIIMYKMLKIISFKI